MRLALYIILLLISGNTMAFSLFGTKNKEKMDYSALSCAELYRMASGIEPETQRRRSVIVNERSDQLAAAIGTVITVGYYYYGYRAANAYLQDYRIARNLHDLDEIRQYMASQRCFQRD